jgi:DNA-binding NtrC family response regulator
MAIAWILQINKVAECVLCSSGQQACDALKESPDIKVAIVDLRMADALGTHITRQLKTIRPNLLAILHTGHNDLANVGLAEDEALFCATLPKPASSNKEVSDLVARVLSQAQTIAD